MNKIRNNLSFITSELDNSQLTQKEGSQDFQKLSIETPKQPFMYM